jgi:peptidyl-prolyl cis-trans isomerase D
MFGTIRKHQGWLWAVIGTLTILSFVVFGPTNTRIGNALNRQGDYGMIGGRAVKFDERVNAQHEIELDQFLKNQQWPNLNDPQILQNIYTHLFLVRKMQEMDVKISTDAAAALARRVLGQTSLDDFTEKILKPQGMDAGDFDRFIRHTLGIQQLIETAGVSGKMVTPQEAETMYGLEHQDVEALLVNFSASNFLSSVTATPEQIAQFYTNQLDNYRVPEQVSVSYVKFEATNYYPTVEATLTNMDQMIEAASQRIGTNFYPGTKTIAESKAAIRTEILREHGVMEARRAAGQFAEKLDQTTPRTPASLTNLATASNLTVRATALFDRDYGPQDITVPPDFTRDAFSLTDADPFGGPIPARDGVYVIAESRRVPARIPPLKEIEAKVTEDYRYMNAIQLARQSAVNFDNTLTNGLAAGKGFATLCAQSNNKYESLPAFSLSSTSLPGNVDSHISLDSLKRIAFGTPPGQASQVAGSSDGAFVIYVEKTVPVNADKLKQELPDFIAGLRRERQGEAFNAWLNGQMRQDADFMQLMQKLSGEGQSKTPAQRRS